MTTEIIKNHKARSKAKRILLLGVLSFFLVGAITGVPAVIMGHRELKKHKKGEALYSDLDQTDRRIIIGGMILGYIGILLTIYLVFLVVAVYLNCLVGV